MYTTTTMSCPCFHERNAVIERPQNPRIVRQVSRRTNERAALPGGLRRVSGSTRASGRTSMSLSLNLSEKDIELKVINRCVCHKAEDGQEEINVEQTTSPTASIPTHAHAHGRSTALPPKGILKHPTKRFPFEDPVAVQRATGLRFEVGKLSSEFTLDDPDMVEVHAYKQNRGGKQPRDSMVVVDEARTRARKRFLSERGSREALLGEERI